MAIADLSVSGHGYRKRLAVPINEAPLHTWLVERESQAVVGREIRGQRRSAMRFEIGR
ncbi:hypothetical protein D3C80_1882720 [compost metagenome]